MKTIEQIATFALPVLFVLLAIRISLEALAPSILPLCGVAFVGLVAWLWLRPRI
jgi:hypothetical protein